MTWRRNNAAVLLGTVAVLAAGCADDSQLEGSQSQSGIERLELKIASPAGPGSLYGASAQWFADELSERSDGQITAQPFHAGSLLAGTEILPGIVDGRTDVGFTATVYHPKEFAALNVVAEPFVTSNGVAAASTMSDLLEENETLAGEFERLGLRPLFFIPLGSGVFGTPEPIDSLDDFKGKVFRATGTTEKVLAPVGAEATFTEFSELYEAVERGTVDGWAGVDFSTVVDASLYEVTPHFLHTNSGIVGLGVAAMSNEQWDALSEEQREVIEEVSNDYMDWLPGAFTEIESAACETFLAGGGKPSILPDGETERWDELVGDSVHNTLLESAQAAGVSQEAFDQLLSEYVDTVAEREDEVDYTDGMKACAKRSR